MTARSLAALLLATVVGGCSVRATETPTEGDDIVAAPRRANSSGEASHPSESAPPNRQEEDLEQLGKFALDDRGAGFALVRGTRYALVEFEGAGLESGRSYVFRLGPAHASHEGGPTVHRLIEARRVTHFVGTLTDDATAPEVLRLHTTRGNEILLTGETATSFKEIRSSLPEYDYASTLFRIDAVAERAPSTRWQWLTYELVPSFECGRRDAPQVRLDLVTVRPDHSILDGFIRTDGGPEAVYGAHAECRAADNGYRCTLDIAGVPFARASFTPRDRFEVVVEELQVKARSTFSCARVSPERAAGGSEG